MIWFGWCLIPNSFYTHILNIYDLVYFGVMAYQPFIGYLMQNPVFTYILNI